MEHNKSFLDELEQYWWVALIAIIFLVLGGGSVKLTCSREGENTGITCIKQPMMLWIIPLKTKTIPEVREARLADTSDSEGGSVYRVELVTGQGIVPLTTMYSSGKSTKAEVVDQINAFMSDPNQGDLTVHEPGLLSLENLFCLVIWMPISLAFHWFWEQIRSERSRARN